MESKIMMVPLAIENLYIKDKKDKVREDKTIYCEDLYLLIPNEIKPMLQDYKIKMSNFIKDYLSNTKDCETTFEEKQWNIKNIKSKDVLEIINVFSARLYGCRSKKNKKLLEKIKEAAEAER